MEIFNIADIVFKLQKPILQHNVVLDSLQSMLIFTLFVVIISIIIFYKKLEKIKFIKLIIGLMVLMSLSFGVILTFQVYKIGYKYSKSINEEEKKKIVIYNNVIIHQKYKDKTFEDYKTFYKENGYKENYFNKLYNEVKLIPFYSNKDLNNLKTLLEIIKKDKIIYKYEYLQLTKTLENLGNKQKDLFYQKHSEYKKIF